jgi:hypothetical protein
MLARLITVLLFSLVFTAPVALAAAKTATSIKKCQDATGKWHYGDSAALECSKSKVDVLSKEGVKTNEIAAPLTDAELAEREKNKEELAREQRSVEDQKKRDQILLQSYPHEDDILLYRDRKLSQLETTVTSSEETLKSLRKVLERLEVQKQSDVEQNDKKALALTEKSLTQTRNQIQKHELVVTQTRKEQERLRKQFEEDVTRYRELKRHQSSVATPK